MTIEQDDAALGYPLEIRRVINGPRHLVWRAWTEPELVKQWFCPRPWRVTVADFALRPGGRMNNRMEGPNGEAFDNKGIFLEIVPERRLVVTDSFTEGYIPQPSPFVTLYVELSDMADGRTDMVWGARHPNAETKAKHLEMGFEQGWNAAADQLDEVVRALVASEAA